MASPADSQHTRLKRSIALLLTFSAGIVDIAGYLSLYHTFTAHMTGTTVHLGNSLVSKHWPEAAISACVVAAFVAGSIVGRTIIEVGARRGVRSVAAITLALEGVLLLVFIPAATHSLAAHGSGESSALTAPLLAMLATAMGLQTAALTRIGSLTVHTTFVTGMLNKLAQLISYALYAWWDALTCDVAERECHTTRRRDVSAQAIFIFAIWLLYLVGAAIGTWMHSRWGTRALFVPVAALFVAIVTDVVQPFALEEEHDELERQRV